MVLLVFQNLKKFTFVFCIGARYNIILGMGSALLYLHQEWEQCVVHRDIKPSNVMLDSSFNAKLGDFGLARLVNHSHAAHTTMLAGTKGYIDPECVVTCRTSAQSDVYSFGVVLLEIACGRKPVVPQEDEDKVLLVHWVWDMYGRGELLDAADARLHDAGEFDVLEMERTLVVGLWCMHPDSASRPSIRQAMNVLQFEVPLPELPLEMPVATYGPPNISRGYRSSTTSSSVRENTPAGHSSTSDWTAHSSGGSSVKSDDTQGTRTFVTSNTRNTARGSVQEPTSSPSRISDRSSTRSSGGTLGQD
jgi:serine/threonine protein kinase